MERDEMGGRFRAIRDNLPITYSQQSARKLMSSFENYRQAVQTLGNKNTNLFSGVQSEFGDIEFDIKWAIKGTPKKEAEARFAEAKRHIRDDINSILAVLEMSGE
jgi:hypothetical protein